MWGWKLSDGPKKGVSKNVYIKKVGPQQNEDCDGWVCEGRTGQKKVKEARRGQADKAASRNFRGKSGR